jgi:hypothetical protein
MLPYFKALLLIRLYWDRLCGLVVRVPGYRSRGPGFESRRHQIFWEIVGLERGPLSLMRITEGLLERITAAPVWKTEINSRGDSLRWPRDTFYPLKLALSSPTSGGRSVDIVRCQTEAPELKKSKDGTQTRWLTIFMHLVRIIVNRNITILAETTRTNPTAIYHTSSVEEQTCYVSRTSGLYHWIR